MDLRAAILKEHSKQQALMIRDYIGADEEKFDQLMTLFLADEYRVTQRAAWVLSHCADKYPFLIFPYMDRLVKKLGQKDIHVAVKRNIIRILQEQDIPEQQMGLLADFCFNFLADPKETVAVRVFSMQVLFNLCKKEPGLANELKILIDEFMPHGTAGFKSRGKKILKGLQALLSQGF